MAILTKSILLCCVMPLLSTTEQIVTCAGKPNGAGVETPSLLQRHSAVDQPQEHLAEDICFSDEDLKSSYKVRVGDGQKKYQDFEVPAMSTDPSVYRYALDNAFVVLPLRCVVALGLQPNVGDSNNHITQWMGRVGDLKQASPDMTAEARDAILSNCTCGWTIFLHGSGGFTNDNPRYCIMMASAGYGVLAPDSFASSTLGLRHKAPIVSLSEHLRELNSEKGSYTYWCSDNVYEEGTRCTPSMARSHLHRYPLCYDSDAATILSHPQDWQDYYERVFKLRQLELDFLVENMPMYINDASKVFLAGESEGGMVAARYSHPRLEPLLERGGRIILQWSCEFSYYVSCPLHAQIGGGGKANISTPVLNMIAEKDPYFGAQGPDNASIAFAVANGAGGYGVKGAAETGNCFSQFNAQGLQHAYAITVISSDHGLTMNTGNLVRSALFSFLANPRSSKALTQLGFGREGAGICNFDSISGAGKIHGRCTELGRKRPVPGTMMPKCAYKNYSYHTQFYFKGEFETCASEVWPNSSPRAESARSWTTQQAATRHVLTLVCPAAFVAALASW